MWPTWANMARLDPFNWPGWANLKFGPSGPHWPWSAEIGPVTVTAEGPDTQGIQYISTLGNRLNVLAPSVQVGHTSWPDRAIVTQEGQRKKGPTGPCLQTQTATRLHAESGSRVAIYP